MDSSSLSTPAFINFDKGLRSRALGDQLQAIVGTSSLLRDYPFPTLVNLVVLRLAEAFKDGYAPNQMMNSQLRTCIARVLADSSEHLSLIFSTEEILKRIFTVSHSNDPSSRALTLEVLGTLAVVYAGSKKVHHLILESLTVENDFEFECTTHALVAYAKISTEFAAATVERLSVLLTSSELTVKRKIKLLPAIASMKSDVKATKECFQIERYLLDSSTHVSLVCALLTAMTNLAKSTRYTAPEQAEILLIAAINSDTNLGIRITALMELVKLAKYAHVWEENHLAKLKEVKAKVEQAEPVTLNKFLRVLISLSSRYRTNHSAFFDDMLEQLKYLFTSERIDTRILFIQFACNCYVGQPNEVLSMKLLSAFSITLQVLQGKHRARMFLQSLSKFLCSPSINQDHMNSLLRPLLQSQFQEENGQLVAELFCQVGNIKPVAIQDVSQWCRMQLGSLANPDIFNSPAAEAIFWLLIPPTIEYPEGLTALSNGDDWEKYYISRIAFRNGHWRVVAYENLSKIELSSLSSTQKLWIQTLQKLAYSQIREFTIDSLKKQREALLEAHNKATELVEFDNNFCFIFTKQLIKALHLLSSTLHGFFSGIALSMQFDPNVTNPTNLKRIKISLENCYRNLQKCDVAWSELYRSSFTGEHTTLDYLSYMHSSVLLIKNGIQRLINVDAIREMLIPDLIKETTISMVGLERLHLAKAHVDGLQQLSGQSFKAWKDIVEGLYLYRHGCPRLVFQQVYQFEIKLSVNSANNGEMTVQANHMQPIHIDGFIKTNHPTKIESVIITAAIQYHTSIANNSNHSSVVKLNGETHFSTQMMLSFRQSCNMELSIEFVDAQKRNWASSVKTKVKVNINE